MDKVLGSLRFRSAGAHTLIIVVAFAALALYLLPKIEGDFRGSIEDDLASQARMVQNLAAPLFEAGAPRAEFDGLAKELGADTGTRITIIASDGTVLGDSEAEPTETENHFSRPEVMEALVSGRGSDERTSATVGDSFTYVALRVGEEGSPAGFVRAARTSASVDTTLSDVTRSVLIAVLVAALAAATVSLLISETVLHPLGRLVTAARSIATGRLEERIEPRPAGEVGELADAFNQMGEELQGLMAAASQERNRMVAALHSSSDAIFALDKDGSVKFANGAAERLFMLRQDELVGNPLVWVIPQQDVVNAIQTSREDGRRKSVIIERPNRALRVVAAPIIGGGEWASLVVIHDVTEIRRVEEMRRDFIANVSHELRTPLAGIKSVIETLQGGAVDDPAAARDFLARADHEVDRLVQMVEELLELSRIESGQVPLAHEPVDVAGLLERGVERLRGQAEKKGQTLIVDVVPGLPAVVGDTDRLERAVISLVHNAIKFTPEGGAIDVFARSNNGELIVTVRDNGEGIDPTDLPRVFERFYKADRARRGDSSTRGTGLGLAIVKHTIEAHGGSVSVKSERGRGSTFSVTIPVAASAR